MNEADTCREYVLPLLRQAGWDEAPHSFTEQRTFTDGRIIPLGNRIKRGKQKRADYLLRYTRDLVLAVVEAKPDYKAPGDGLQQAKDYAQVLGLRYAYATNGRGIIEFDFSTGLETTRADFPRPAELWARQRAAEGLAEGQLDPVLAPYNLQAGKLPRYYQDLAIRRVVQAIAQGRQRLLLTMATGTGKTMVAFQICWKLWSSRWNRTGAYRRPKILFLADRSVLVNDPKDKDFSVFGDAAIKIEHGETTRSRDIYFATYQAIARDERRPGLYRAYPPDFFDLIIVDECHRGSAGDESCWREILEYFQPAVQLGMTATPLREENRDTYAYFGNPLYTYSLRQGIEDGFLAPYRVHRIITSVDAAGWRPYVGQVDRFFREVPDAEYHTKDFERTLVLKARTEAIAKHLTSYLRATDRYAKTVVFCADQEHADEMRRLLSNLNADRVQIDPDYVCRITSDEGEIGQGHLGRFKDVDTVSPVIATTSQLLSTGIDMPTVKNVVLARVVGSMTEFKQIIGRGTRVRDEYEKFYFTILDYTGSATAHFADPDFDGDPALIVEIQIDDEGNPVTGETLQPETDPEPPEPREADGFSPGRVDDVPEAEEPHKYYVDEGAVEIVHQLVYELDTEGNRLRCAQYSDYAADKVRSLYPNAADLRHRWADAVQRREIIDQLEERGISFEELAAATGRPEADPFDLLCHLAYNAPLRTRRERADRLRKDQQDHFERYGPEARAILDDLLTKYAEHGLAQFALPDVLKLPPISQRGNVSEIARLFGGAEQLRAAVADLQAQLYAA